MIVEKPNFELLQELDTKYQLSVNMNCISANGPESHHFLKNLQPHPTRNEKEVTELFGYLAERGELFGEIVETSIPDLTSKEDIPVVQEFLKRNP